MSVFHHPQTDNKNLFFFCFPWMLSTSIQRKNKRKKTPFFLSNVLPVVYFCFPWMPSTSIKGKTKEKKPLFPPQACFSLCTFVFLECLPQALKEKQKKKNPFFPLKRVSRCVLSLSWLSLEEQNINVPPNLKKTNKCKFKHVSPFKNVFFHIFYST